MGGVAAVNVAHSHQDFLFSVTAVWGWTGGGQLDS